jgi:hypothetical protein
MVRLEVARPKPIQEKLGLKSRDLAIWTVIYGVLWNGLGWIGNNLVLASAWDAVSLNANPGFPPPYTGLAREAMTLVPDFLYAFGFVWLFAHMRVQTVVSALALALVLEIFVIITYLAMVTSGFLPWTIAVQTSLLALVIFLATAPLLPIFSRPPRKADDPG